MVLLVVVGVVVGGFAEIGPTSSAYRRSVDGSFVQQVSPLASRNAQLAAELAQVQSRGPAESRQELFSQLDELASVTHSISDSAAAMDTPGSVALPATSCRSSLALRATAMSGMRESVEALLGGADGSRGGSETAAVDALSHVGGELATADADWEGCRARLSASPGHKHLAPSLWLTDPGLWSDDAISKFVADLDGSATLAPKRDLAVTSLTTDPGVVSVRGLEQVIPPTQGFAIMLTVSNEGNVTTPGVVITTTLVHVSANVVGPGAVERPPSQTITLQAGRSQVVDVGGMEVVPGGTYGLAVAVNGQGASASSQFQIVVATNPPPTTTTTAATTTTK